MLRLLHFVRNDEKPLSEVDSTLQMLLHLYNLIKTKVMEDNTKPIELLLESAAEYGKTSYELAKLKVLDKTADIVSSFIPHSVVIALIAAFMLFLSLGIAFWLGGILGKSYFGFFVVAAFYAITGIAFYFLMHKWIKKIVCNFIIKQVLK